MNSSKIDSLERIMSSLLILMQTLAFYFVWRTYYNPILAKSYLFKGNAMMICLYAAAVVLCYKSLDSLKPNISSFYNLAVSHVISDAMADVMTYVILILVFRGATTVLPIIMLFGINIAVSLLWISLCKFVFKKFVKGRKCILFYTDDDPEYLKQKIEQRKDQFVIEKAVHVNSIKNIRNESFEDFECAMIAYMPSDYRNEILKICFEKNIEAVITPKVSDVLIRGAKELNIYDQPMFVLGNNNRINLMQRFIKRAFDIVFSLIVLILSSPITLAVALAIKLEDGGPVFYKQKRCTLNEREFEIYKFRSMIVDAEKNHKAVLASKEDSRITKVGKFIRATRIDEIPQFINIIKGDMSVVGPRPERKELIDKYSKYVEAFPYRTKVKAGLTGYAQIMGKYNSNPYNKLLFDLMYVQKFSVILDMKLILMTIKIVFMKESTEGVDEEFDMFMETFTKTLEKKSAEELN